MSKLKVPRPYVSNSQFSLFTRDPMEYYEQYFVAGIEKEGEPLTIGKIFQQAWCDKKYDYAKALEEAGLAERF